MRIRRLHIWCGIWLVALATTLFLLATAYEVKTRLVTGTDWTREQFSAHRDLSHLIEHIPPASRNISFYSKPYSAFLFAEFQIPEESLVRWLEANVKRRDLRGAPTVEYMYNAKGRNQVIDLSRGFVLEGTRARASGWWYMILYNADTKKALFNVGHGRSHLQEVDDGVDSSD